MNSTDIPQAYKYGKEHTLVRDQYTWNFQIHFLKHKLSVEDQNNEKLCN